MTSHGDTHLNPPMCLLIDGCMPVVTPTISASHFSSPFPASPVRMCYIPLFPSFPLTAEWEWERAAAEMLDRHTYTKK